MKELSVILRTPLFLWVGVITLSVLIPTNGAWSQRRFTSICSKWFWFKSSVSTSANSHCRLSSDDKYLVNDLPCNINLNGPSQACYTNTILVYHKGNTFIYVFGSFPRCMIIYTRVHTVIRIYAPIRIHADSESHTHTHTHIHACIYIYIYVCVCVCVCMCVCVVKTLNKSYWMKIFKNGKKTQDLQRLVIFIELFAIVKCFGFYTFLMSYEWFNKTKKLRIFWTFNFCFLMYAKFIFLIHITSIYLSIYLSFF